MISFYYCIECIYTVENTFKVFSGPPNVVFTWRHWGQLEGTFQDHQVEIFIIIMDKDRDKVVKDKDHQVEIFMIIVTTLVSDRAAKKALDVALVYFSHKQL